MGITTTLNRVGNEKRIAGVAIGEGLAWIVAAYWLQWSPEENPISTFHGRRLQAAASA